MLLAGAAQGFVVPVGQNLVVPAFNANRVDGAVLTTLQFRDAGTGKVKASQTLPVGHWNGMSADTIGGKPVLVVRYQSTAPEVQAGNGGKALNVTQVFDANGKPVWTSEPDAMAGRDGFPAFSNGYWLRAAPDGGRQVVDTTGNVALQIAAQGQGSDPMNTYLADGVVLTQYEDTNIFTNTYKAYFTVYDLAHGARKAGDFTEPTVDSFDPSIGVLAASGSKILITWPSSDATASDGNALIVFDTATGATTTPIQTKDLMQSPAAMIDPDSGNALVYSTDQTSHVTTMVRLSDGKELWQQTTGGLYPVSMHRGTLYGITVDVNTHVVTRLTIDEAAGTQSVGDYQVAPVAFVGDRGVFVADDGPTAGGGAILLAVCTAS